MNVRFCIVTVIPANTPAELFGVQYYDRLSNVLSLPFTFHVVEGDEAFGFAAPDYVQQLQSDEPAVIYTQYRVHLDDIDDVRVE